MSEKKFNECIAWGLRCYEQKLTEKTVVLKCNMNHKDKETGEYTAPVYIDVICVLENCEIEEDDYAKSYITVDGRFSTGEYTNKNGEKVPTLKIFATKVEKAVFE